MTTTDIQACVVSRITCVKMATVDQVTIKRPTYQQEQNLNGSKKYFSVSTLLTYRFGEDAHTRDLDSLLGSTYIYPWYY